MTPDSPPAPGPEIPEPTEADFTGFGTVAQIYKHLASVHRRNEPTIEFAVPALLAYFRRLAAAETRAKVTDDALVSIQVYCRSVTDNGLRGLVQQVLDNVPWLLEDTERYIGETEVLKVTADELAAVTAERVKALASVDGVDLREGHIVDNADPDQLRDMLYGAGLALAAERASAGRLREALQEVWAVKERLGPVLQDQIRTALAAPETKDG